MSLLFFFFFQAEDGIRDVAVTGVQTCALPISAGKALKFTNATVFGLCKPFIQVRVSMFGQHRDECLGQIISDVEITVSRADLRDLLALLLVKLDSLTHIEPGGSCWGQTAFDAGCGSRIDGSTDFGTIGRKFELRRGSCCPMVLAHARNEEPKQGL